MIAPDRASETVAWVITTHGNLIRYLTTGLIFPIGAQVPRWAIGRWHTDPAAHTGDCLPIFFAPPGPDLIAAFVDTTRHQSPVLIELRADLLGNFAGTVDRDYQAQGPAARVTPGSLVGFINGVLPTSYIARVVFHDESARTSFMARAVANFDPTLLAPPVASDPDVFAGTLDPNRLRPAFAAMRGTGAPIPTAQADMLSGAAMRVAKFVAARRDFPLSRFTAFLNTIWQRSPAPPDSTLDPNDVISVGTNALMPLPTPWPDDDATSPATVIGFALQLINAEPGLAADPKRLLEALAHQAPEHQALLVRFIAIADALEPESSLPPGVPEHLLGLLDFCKQGPNAGCPVPPSGNLERLLVTAMLAGAATGRSQLADEDRPALALASRIDGLVALRVHAAAGVSSPLIQSVPPLQVQRDANADPPIEWLEIRKERMLVRPAILVEPVVVTDQPVNPPESLTEVVIPFDQPEMMREVLALCGACGWTDLGTTEMTVPSLAISSASADHITLRFTRLVTAAAMTHTLDTKAFTRRLTTKWTSIDDATWSVAPALRILVDGSDSRPPPSRPEIPAPLIDALATTTRSKFNKADQVYLAAYLRDAECQRSAVDIDAIRSFFAERHCTIGAKAITNLAKKLGFEIRHGTWQRIVHVGMQPLNLDDDVLSAS